MESTNICDIRNERTLYRSLTFHEILSKLSSGIISFGADAAKPGTNDWQAMLSYEEFAPFLVSKLMLSATTYHYDSLFNHWYVKGPQTSYGPFSLLQMLEFFQQKRIDFQTLVRHPSFSTWEPLETSGPFELKSLERLLAQPEVKDVVTRRRHPRVRYDNEVFISNSGDLHRGVTWSLSPGGLGIVTDDSTNMKLNDRVNVIINSNNDHGSVQVKGRIVNLQKEVNYERLALEFEVENEYLTNYIQQRVPET